MPTVLMPHKTIGAFTVYERRPKPFGATKYVVVRDGDGKALEDFGRYARAVRWCKKQTEKPTTEQV